MQKNMNVEIAPLAIGERTQEPAKIEKSNINIEPMQGVFREYSPFI